MGKRWRLSISVLMGVLAAAVVVAGGMVAITGSGRNAASTVHAAVVVRATKLGGQAGALPGHDLLSVPVVSATSTAAPIADTSTTSTTTVSTPGGTTITTPVPRQGALPPTATKSATRAASVPSVTTTTVLAPSNSNGTGVWTTESQGFTITLQIQPVDPVAGQNVELTVTASSSTQWCCLIGATVGPTAEPPFMPSNACPLTVPSTTTQTYNQVFDAPATYLVEVTVSGGKLCVGPPDLVNAHFQASVVIGATSAAGD